MTVDTNPAPLTKLSEDEFRFLMSQIRSAKSQRDFQALGGRLWLHCCLVALVPPSEVATPVKPCYKAILRFYTEHLNKAQVYAPLVGPERIAKSANAAYQAALEARAARQGGVSQHMLFGEVD